MKSTILSITIFAIFAANLDARVLSKSNGLKSSASKSHDTSSHSSEHVATRSQENGVVNQKIKSQMSIDEDVESRSNRSESTRKSGKIMLAKDKSENSSHQVIEQVSHRSPRAKSPSHKTSETSSLKTNSHATHSHATNESCNRLKSHRVKDLESHVSSNKTDAIEEIVIKKDIQVLSQKSTEVEETSQKSVKSNQVDENKPKTKKEGASITTSVIGFMALITML